MQPASFAAGVRGHFPDLPVEVRAWVTDQLGGTITDVEEKRGGFSPGVTAVVRTAARSGFVKAVSDGFNPQSLQLARNERDRHDRLPDIDGVLRPEATTELVIGDETWSVMIFPALVGRAPSHPWTEDDAARVLAEMERLSALLTPSPWPAEEAAGLSGFFSRWDVVASDPDDDWHQDPWVSARLAELTVAEKHLQEALTGNTLTHTDLRADNIVLTADRVWFIDWAHARTAARWLDPLMLFTDLIVSGADVGDGGELDLMAMLREQPCFAEIAPEIRWSVLAGVAGAMHVACQRPPVEGLPTMRPWQRLTSERLLIFLKRYAP